MHFRLKDRDFEEINPEIRFSRFNAMAFVARIQNEQPTKIEIEFDGSTESMMFLNELASDIGYFANIEGVVAFFEKV